ncbi:MAG: hypothetical protein AB1610_06750 [Nitrospirota bacterium]
MRKFILVTVLIMAVLMITGTAMALTWVVSPYSPSGGTIVFGETNIVAVTDINDPQSGTQEEAIYGAGFETSASGVIFDADLYTWDSYSITGDASNDGGSKGWWDVFVVNINQEGYYWELVSGGSGTIDDPVISSTYEGGYALYDNSVLPGATWVFGGEDYGNGTLESLSPLTDYTLIMTGGDPNLPYYVSVILDTATDPYSDTSVLSLTDLYI